MDRPLRSSNFGSFFYILPPGVEVSQISVLFSKNRRFPFLTSVGTSRAALQTKKTAAGRLPRSAVFQMRPSHPAVLRVFFFHMFSPFLSVRRFLYKVVAFLCGVPLRRSCAAFLCSFRNALCGARRFAYRLSRSACLSAHSRTCARADSARPMASATCPEAVPP